MLPFNDATTIDLESNTEVLERNHVKISLVVFQLIRLYILNGRDTKLNIVNHFIFVPQYLITNTYN